MWLLILEALAALSLLLFIVWWTMFSGRRPDPPDARETHDTRETRPGDAGADAHRDRDT